MSYGLEVYKADGTLVYSTDSVTWMQVDSFSVAANETVYKSYPEFSGWTIKTFIDLVDQSPSDQEHYSPRSIVSGINVTISPQSGLTSFPARVIILAQG